LFKKEIVSVISIFILTDIVKEIEEIKGFYKNPSPFPKINCDLKICLDGKTLFKKGHYIVTKLCKIGLKASNRCKNIATYTIFSKGSVRHQW